MYPGDSCFPEEVRKLHGKGSADPHEQDFTFNLMAKSMRDARPDLDQVIAAGNSEDLTSAIGPLIKIDTSKAEDELGVTRERLSKSLAICTEPCGRYSIQADDR